MLKLISNFFSLWFAADIENPNALKPLYAFLQEEGVQEKFD